MDIINCIALHHSQHRTKKNIDTSKKQTKKRFSQIKHSCVEPRTCCTY